MLVPLVNSLRQHLTRISFGFSRTNPTQKRKSWFWWEKRVQNLFPSQIVFSACFCHKRAKKSQVNLYRNNPKTVRFHIQIRIRWHQSLPRSFSVFPHKFEACGCDSKCVRNCFLNYLFFGEISNKVTQFIC